MDAYTGLPGSGKSYGIVKNLILPALKEGREVWTNIPMHNDLLLEDFGSAVTQFDIIDIQDNKNWFQDVLPKGAVVIIDECQMIWPNGLKANSALEQHRDFFTQYRHFVSEDGHSTLPVIATQDLANVANFVRSMVKFTYRSSDLTAIGKPDHYRIDLFQGPVTGPNPPKRSRMREFYGKFEPDVYKYYKSHTRSDAGAGNESRVDKRANILGSFSLKFMAGLCIAAVLFAFWGIGKVADLYNQGEEPTVEQPRHQPRPSGSGTLVTSRKPSTDYLKGRKMNIVFNMGLGGGTRYMFEVSEDEYWYQLDIRDLKKLGYRVTMINECLVIVRHIESDSAKMVACKPDREYEKENDGFLSFGSKDSDNV